MFFCLTSLNLPLFQASLRTLSVWVADLGSRGVEGKTIKLYVTDVRSNQIDIGLEELHVFHPPPLQRLTQAFAGSTKNVKHVSKDLSLKTFS